MFDNSVPHKLLPDGLPECELQIGTAKLGEKDIRHANDFGLLRVSGINRTKAAKKNNKKNKKKTKNKNSGSRTVMVETKCVHHY